MATFDQCITEALGKGEISAAAAAVAKEAYDDARAAADAMGPIEADRVAADAAMKKLEAERVEARRRRQLMVRARLKAIDDIEAFKVKMGYDGATPPPPGRPGAKGAADALAVELMMEGQGGRAGSGFASAQGRHRALVGKAHALMAEGIEAFESRTGYDQRGRAHLPNIVMEAFGKDSGDQAAKSIYAGFEEAAEWLRQRFNQAGGAIGKMENWGLPQRHDMMAVKKAGREAWVAAVLPRLDRAKMIDRATGAPFSEARLKAALNDTWTTIVSGGANKRDPGEGLGAGALWKRRAEERFLIFRSPEDWMAYQQDFGDPNVWELMVGHIDDLARDVALMQVFGPNPDAQLKWLLNRAKQAAVMEEVNGVAGAQKRAERIEVSVNDMMFHYSGAASNPLRPGVARLGANARNIVSSSALGSAVLSEVPSSVIFGRMTRGFVGLDRNGDMKTMIRLFTDPKARAVARRTGFINEQATDGFIGAHRDGLRLMSVGSDGADANSIARRLPAFTLRASGLTAYVANIKRTFHGEFMGALHDLKDVSWDGLATHDDLSSELRLWMKDRGFTAQDWDVIRSTPVWEPEPGVRFIRPIDVPIEDLGLRLSEGIDMETRFLTPETTLWARARLVGQTRPGTVPGEARRIWATFRGFSLTATKLYAQELAFRAFAGRSVWAGRGHLAAAAAAGLAFLTVAGAVTIQLREIAKGNDPRPMDDPKFWGAALMQGGGLGILGDFLYAAEARNGKTAPIVAAGAAGQLFSDIWNLTGGNVLEVAGGLSDGEDLGEAVEGAQIGRETARFAGNYNPLASGWWSRAAFSRLVADNLQRALDPEAEEAFRRRARRLERETGQGQWWPQGQNAPERAPDLANMAGGED